MTLHPLTLKGGAFVLKLGLVPKQVDEDLCASCKRVGEILLCSDQRERSATCPAHPEQRGGWGVGSDSPYLHQNFHRSPNRNMVDKISTINRKNMISSTNRLLNVFP